MSTINILGIEIDNLSLEEVLNKIKRYLTAKSGQQHYLVTVNPEFIVVAQKDEEFKQILNQAGLAVADGFGLILASKLKKQPLRRKITGVDLIWHLAKLAEQNSYSIFLLGAAKGIAAKAAEKLKVKYPRLAIASESGGEVVVHPKIENLDILRKINNYKPDILLVALGQVKQEKWIKYNLQKLPSVKLAVGVGGSFDFISGKIKRAPKWLRKIGLEWFWRLLRQPRRFKRIYTAVIKFSWLALIKKKI